MKTILKWLNFTLTTLLTAIAFNMFYQPLKIVAGGNTGLGLVLGDIFNIDPSLLIMLISLLILIISAFNVEKEKIISALYAAISLPLFIKLTADLPNCFELGITEPLLIAVICGLLSGLSSALDSKNGFSSGGIILLSESLHKRTMIPLAKINAFLNIIIVIIGAYNGLMNLIYAFIVIYVSTIVYEKIFLGISSNKTFYIITKKELELTEYLQTEGYGVTCVKVQGAYAKEDKDMLMTVIPTYEYNRIKENIENIDSQVFIVVTDSYYVNGVLQSGIIKNKEKYEINKH